MQKAPGLYLPPGHGAPVLSFPNQCVKSTPNKGETISKVVTVSVELAP
jgi:hypothetical protein